MGSRTSIRRFAALLGIGVVSLWLLTGGCPAPSGDGGGDGGGSSGGSSGSGSGGGSTGEGSSGGGSGGGLPGSGTGGGGSGIGGSTGGGSSSGGSGGGVPGGGTGGGGSSGGGSPGGGGTPTPTAIVRTVIAQSGMPVPSQPEGVTFTAFSNPVVDATGRVAFWASYAGSGAKGFGGLYVWQNGTLSKVIDDDPSVTGVVPGRTTADYFGPFQKTGSFDPLGQPLTWAGGDRLLFVSRVGGERPSRGYYRWRATDQSLARIADLEQIAAFYTDAASGAFAATFDLPGISDGGLAYVPVSYVYFTAPPGAQLKTGQALFLSNGTAVVQLVDTLKSIATKGDVPDQGTTAYYTSLDTLTSANGSDLLYEASYFPGTGVSGRGTTGVYLARASVSGGALRGATYRVIDSRTTTSWPGLTGRALDPNEEGYTLALGPAGHIAIQATLAVGSQNRPGVIVWDWGAENWVELTSAVGTPASALVSGVNDDGQCVVLIGGAPYLASRTGRTPLSAALPAELGAATLTWSSSGGAVNNIGRAVVPYTNGGKSGLAFWTGERLLLVADAALNLPQPDTKSIATILMPERDRPGRSGLLNDRDEIVFRVVKNDNTEYIYLARAE